MAPTKAELAPWKWVGITEPEKVKLDHILEAYRLRGACLPRCPYKCIRNCRKNPYCLWCLGEKAWTTSGSKENSDGEANLEFRREEDFVGIINLGSTCYVNALLQLWFHNPIIRPAILSLHPTYAVNLDSKLDPLCTLWQLQAMFARMKFSKRSAINPTTLIESLNLDVGEEQDAHEFGNFFMSLLLQLASEENVSKELTRAFEGTWKYETECKVCASKTFTKEKFTELDLCVLGAEDIAASFAALFTEEELFGDNQYLCENCVGKTDAICRLQLLKLPPVLNIQLLRFTYDKDTRRNKKVTTPYTFPEYLDMAPYVQTSSTCGTSGTNPSTSNSSESSDNAHKYQLTGYLVHNGRSASSGHYVTHIRDIRSGAWHIFNDEAVYEQKASKSGAKSVAKKDKEEEDSTFKVEKTRDHKSTGAYMLVYTHQSLIESPPPDPDIPEYLKNLIELENATFESEIQTTKKEREMKAQYLEDRKNSVEELYKLLIPGKKPTAALTLCQNEGEKQLQNQNIDSQENNSQNINTNPKDKDGENLPPKLLKGKENQNNPFGKKVKDAKTAKDSKHESTLEAISKAKEYQSKFPVSELDFLPYTWMTSWLNQTVETVPLLSSKDIRCPHSKLALPLGMASVPYKVVPSTVADILYATYGGENKDSDSSLITERLQGEDALCSECVITECRRQRFFLELDVDHKKVTEMSAATGKMIENHNKFAGKDAANFSHEFWKDKVWVSKLSLTKWVILARSAQTAITEFQGPTVLDLNAEITCPHGKLSRDAGLRKTVDLVTWSILEKHFPASTMFNVSASMPCTSCQDLENQNHQVVLENKKLADKIEDLLKDLIKTQNRPQLNNPGEYYFITESFFHEIISFTKNPERKESPLSVDNGNLFCSCTKSLFKYPIEIIEKLKQEVNPKFCVDQHDDQLKQWCLVWPQEWKFLHELFTCKPENEIKVTISLTSSGVGYEYYPGVCESCSQTWREEKHREMSIFTDQPICLQHQDSEEIVMECQSIVMENVRDFPTRKLERALPIPCQNDHTWNDLESSFRVASDHVEQYKIVTEKIVRRDSETDDSSGIIKSIKMFNFMCHKSFEQTWHKNLNFVIGENGSGKSALLSALMIGLGGKALSTSRTSCVTDFIKTGESHAKTVVCLLNKGKLPTDKYGEEISIERTINQQGQSNYKLQFGACAKFKPATKLELDNLLWLLNIQLDNPVVILNQECARSFLNSTDPKYKYKLFALGTGIAQCDELEAEVTKILEEIRVSLKKKKEELMGLRSKMLTLGKWDELVIKCSDYPAKFFELKNELNWSLVKVEEKKKESIIQDIGIAHQRIKEWEVDCDKVVEEKNREKSKLKDVKELRNQQMRLKSSKEDLMSEIGKELYNDADKVCTETDILSKKHELESQVKVLKHIEEKIQSYEDTFKKDCDLEISRYHAAKEELAEEIRKNQETLQSLSQDKELFLKKAQGLRKSIDDTLRQRESIERQIDDITRYLAPKRKKSSAHYDVFGDQMKDLMSKIDKDKKLFIKIPKGPLGACITVKDPLYVDIIQYVLGNKVAGFVVSDPQDAKRLNKLIEESYGKKFIPGVIRPNVTTLKFGDPYDCSKRNASRGTDFVTIYDMIEFDNDDHIIKNALLDIASIECILLFKTQLKALDILTFREKVPKTCTGAYSLDFYSIKPDPNLRITPLNRKTQQAKLIKSSQVTQKSDLPGKLTQLKEELQNFVVPPEDIEEEKSLQDKAAINDKKYLEIRKIVTTLKQRHDNLKEPPSRPCDLTSFVEQLTEVKSEIEPLRAHIVANGKILEDLKATIVRKQDEKKTINTEIYELEKAIGSMESKDKHKAKMAKLESSLVQLRTKIENGKKEVATLQKDFADTTAKIVEVTATASLFGQCVTQPRNESDIKAEYDFMSAEIEQLEIMKTKHSNIRKLYEVVKEQTMLYSSQLERVDALVEKIDIYFKTVREKYFNAKSRCVQGMHETFEYLALSRNYYGELLIDQEKREIFYFICPDNKSLKKIGKDEKDPAKYKSKMIEFASGLSGGEKSFSTICFIIAMWPAMKSPFFILDEFDVYMDARNRAVSLAALMRYAKIHLNNQFIFCSPLELTPMPKPEEAVVIKLLAPKRNGNESDAAVETRGDVSATRKNRKRGRGTQEAGPAKVPRM